MSEFKNADGEWTMSPEGIRAEWAYSAEESFEDDFYARDYEDAEETECGVCGEEHPTDEHADFVDDDWDLDGPAHVREDEWLDGSYEE